MAPIQPTTPITAVMNSPGASSIRHSSHHLPLEKYLIDNAPDFDPAHPDPIASLNFYPKSIATAQKPYGN